jgi:glycosyltransferase involved in cell wall biosynthesis
MLSPASDILLTIVVACNDIERYGPNLLSWAEPAKNAGVEIVVVHDLAGMAPSLAIDSEVLTQIKKICSYVEISAGNPGTGRNIGMERARGTWVAFWDIDDSPNFSEFIQMVTKAEKDQADLAIGNFVMNFVQRGVSQAVETTNLNGFFDPFSFALYPGLWRIAFRRRILGDSKFPESRLGEDRVFLSNLGIFNLKIFFHPESVYTYFRGNSGSLTEEKPNPLEIQKSLTNLRLNNANFNSRSNRLLASQTVVNLIFSGLRTGRFKVDSILRKVPLKAKGFIFTALITGITYRIRFKSHFTIWKVQRVELAGGLGNQLFQYANGLNHGEFVELHYSLGNPNLNDKMLPEIASFRLSNGTIMSNELAEGFILKKLFNLNLRLAGYLRNDRLSLLLISISRKLLKIGLLFLGKGKKTTLGSENLFVGYFQNTDWMLDTKIIEKMRKLCLVDESKFQNSTVALNSNVRRLLIHIRKGDYAAEKKFGILPRKYYELSCGEIICQNEFDELWVFSNDETYAREIVEGLTDLSPYYVPAGMFSPAETLHLMRFFDGYIISNSTFSWWAATLRENLDAPVMAPFPWFKAKRIEKSFFPADWNKIDACHPN